MEKAYAMVLTQFGGPLDYQEFSKPRPKNKEVLIKVIACGICGSDVHVWKGEDKRSRLPMILGHEGIGIIEAMDGEKKYDIMGHALYEGDVVVWNRGVSCKSCYTCLVKRQFYLCPSRWTYGFSKSIYDYPYLNGAYASHVLLTPETEIIRIESREKAGAQEDYAPYASLCCAGTTTACAFEQVKPESGQQVVIQGPGPLGTYGVLFARESGAKTIIVVGGTPERLALCREAGATHVINRCQTQEAERLDLIKEITGGQGADVVYEMAGTPEAVREGIGYLAPGGTYVSAGIAVDTGEIPVNWFRDVVRKNARIQGVWVGDGKNTWQALEVYRRHKPLLDKMISHRLPLTEAHKALQMMERKEVIKALLIP